MTHNRLPGLGRYHSNICDARSSLSLVAFITGGCLDSQPAYTRTIALARRPLCLRHPDDFIKPVSHQCQYAASFQPRLWCQTFHRPINMFELVTLPYVFPKCSRLFTASWRYQARCDDTLDAATIWGGPTVGLNHIGQTPLQTWPHLSAYRSRGT